MPDRVQNLEIVGAVFRSDRNAIAGFQAVFFAQGSSQPRYALGRGAEIAKDVRAIAQSRQARMAFPGAFEPKGEIQRRVPGRLSIVLRFEARRNRAGQAPD
jgi:hypothetical protein